MLEVLTYLHEIRLFPSFPLSATNRQICIESTQIQVLLSGAQAKNTLQQ